MFLKAKQWICSDFVLWEQEAFRLLEFQMQIQRKAAPKPSLTPGVGNFDMSEQTFYVFANSSTSHSLDKVSSL